MLKLQLDSEKLSNLCVFDIKMVVFGNKLITISEERSQYHNILYSSLLRVIWDLWSQNYQPVSCRRQNCLGHKHVAGKKTNPIKLLGTRQHIKLGSRQQAGNSVFFKISCCRQKKNRGASTQMSSIFEKCNCSALYITKK